MATTYQESLRLKYYYNKATVSKENKKICSYTILGPGGWGLQVLTYCAINLSHWVGEAVMSHLEIFFQS